MELRLATARSTKDLDVYLRGSPGDALPRLQEAARLELPDHLRFDVVADARHPTIQAEGMRYEGLRFRAQAHLAGKVYGGSFGIDTAFAEPMLGDPEVVQGSDLLAFAGIEAPAFRVYPLETHIAEKLHAYTLPRSRPNTRVKDLPDLALLASVGPIHAEDLRRAIDQTFAHRAVHVVPACLPPPPEAWEGPYRRIAERDGLRWRKLPDVFDAARTFLDGALSGVGGSWNPEGWRWDG